MNAAEQQIAFSNEQYLRDLEKSFAFERASGVIESECIAEPAGEDENGWWDLDSTEMDLSQEVEYLESRSLLKHHPAHPNWVMIVDSEDEPFAPAEAADPHAQLSATVIHATGSGVAKALDEIGEQLKAFNRGFVRPLLLETRPDLYPPMPKPISKGEDHDEPTL